MSLQHIPSRHTQPARAAAPPPRPKPPTTPAAGAVDPVAAPGADRAEADQRPADGAQPPHGGDMHAGGAASDLLTTREAAVVLRVNHKRLERWRMTGDGPAYVRMTSKSIAYRRCDIDAFVNARLRASTAA